MRLLPREEKFFEQFQAQADLVLKAATVLVDACNGDPSGLPAAAAHIDELEHKGDQIVIEIFRRLNQTFITPLDPEDIHQLGSHLDSCLDALEDTVHCLAAYEISPTPPIVELAALVKKGAAALVNAFAAMAKDAPFIEFCREIDEVEEQADIVHRKAVAELFKTERDAIRVMKLKEILDLLETTTDACEDVADVLQTVMVKNS